MTETNAGRVSDESKIKEPAIEAFRERAEGQPLPAVPRKAIVGDLIHAGRSLERANYAITVAHRSDDLAQASAGDDAEERFLIDASLSSETLLESVESHLENEDDVNDRLLGAINARRQQLRGDSE